MTLGFRLRISPGPGPREARQFVAMLASELSQRIVAGESVRRTHAGDRDAPSCVWLRFEEVPLESCTAWLGTHLLTADLRGPRARRRWFAEVELEQPSAPVAEACRRDFDVRFVRARGPGGQNVNKRATAVQITHRPTGVSVSCDRHRSQARNRAEAERSLERALFCRLQEGPAAQRKLDGWRARRALTTRTPVMRWQVHRTRAGVLVPAPGER